MTQSKEIFISACMIVKDEEEFLEGCLQSLEGIADEVVVVDTGSTDRTRDIARSFGSRLYSFSWVDDFSAARNEALKKAKGKWILSIDADERLRPLPRSYIQKLVIDPSKIAYTCKYYYLKNWTGLYRLRLFRNDSRIRFTGILHATVDDAVKEVALSDGLQIGKCNLVFNHLGYEGDSYKKYQRDLPLLIKDLEQNPENSFTWCRLGLIYYHLGKERRAQEANEKAIELVRKRGEFFPDESYPYIYLIQKRLSQEKDVGSLVEEALTHFPENPTLAFLKGRTLMHEKRFEDAIPFFKQLVSRGKEKDFDDSVAHDRRIFDEYAFDALATCYFRLGEHSKASESFQIAYLHAPDQFEYRVKRDFCFQLIHKESNLT